MKRAKLREQLNNINIELCRILCTQDVEKVKAWWSKPNTLFAPTPLEYMLTFPNDALKEILNWSKNYKGL